jgi:hypothetical protein
MKDRTGLGRTGSDKLIGPTIQEYPWNTALVAEDLNMLQAMDAEHRYMMVLVKSRIDLVTGDHHLSFFGSLSDVFLLGTFIGIVHNAEMTRFRVASLLLLPVPAVLDRPRQTDLHPADT